MYGWVCSHARPHSQHSHVDVAPFSTPHSCNCNHFTEELCMAISGQQIPDWINRPAKTGAAALEALNAPLKVQRMFVCVHINAPPQVRATSHAFMHIRGYIRYSGTCSGRRTRTQSTPRRHWTAYLPSLPCQSLPILSCQKTRRRNAPWGALRAGSPPVVCTHAHAHMHMHMHAWMFNRMPLALLGAGLCRVGSARGPSLSLSLSLSSLSHAHSVTYHSRFNEYGRGPDAASMASGCWCRECE